MELIKFIFSSFWIWFGFFLFLLVICGTIVDCFNAMFKKDKTTQVTENNLEKEESKKEN